MMPEFLCLGCKSEERIGLKMCCSHLEFGLDVGAENNCLAFGKCC